MRRVSSDEVSQPGWKDMKKGKGCRRRRHSLRPRRRLLLSASGLRLIRTRPHDVAVLGASRPVICRWLSRTYACILSQTAPRSEGKSIALACIQDNVFSAAIRPILFTHTYSQSQQRRALTFSSRISIDHHHDRSRTRQPLCPPDLQSPP